MKKIIKINESDLTRIVKKILKESEYNTDSLSIGKSKKICNQCVKQIEGVEKIPACNEFCTKMGVNDEKVKRCLDGYKSSTDSGSVNDDQSNLYDLTACISYNRR
jgi:hypothetical protein